MTLKKLTNVIRFHLATTFLALFIVSCAVQKPTTVKRSEQKKVIASTANALNADHFIAQSKQQTPALAIISLLIASEYAFANKNELQALWIANQVTPLLTENKYRYRAILVKAQVLFAQGYIEQTLAQLSQLNELSIPHNATYYQLVSQVHTSRGFPVLALIAKLEEFSLNTNASNEDVYHLWQAFQTLTPWQINEIDNQSPAYSKGWIRLTRWANQFGSNEKQFKRYLKQWQRQFPTHPANILLEEILPTLNNRNLAAENIAVLLPLSGRQKAAGNAAQQGLLAAYTNKPNSKLHFFDTETIDWKMLPEQLVNHDTQWVIGPLLRNNVAQYLSNEALNLPTLLLNLPPEIALKRHQFAISMRPEDEALQAAATLSKKHYKTPLVLVHQDTVSQRIANTFTTEWARISGSTPRVMPFSNGKKMQSMLKTALDVFQSENRIKDLNNRITHTIKADARNRRDIDMIYIIGSATQTRLLKPYIDVSISPFASMIPIYASSRSHSAKIDESDTQDLVGLTFSEMPWLLTSKQQNKPLKQLSNSLFPDRSDSLQRIFAMGYDALMLVDKVEKMAERPYIRHYGQTGVLTLNDRQILTRSLIWGRYQNASVTEVAMD